ncbi:MerR family transcriptional regulator [Thermophilibacter sp.]
MERGYTIGQLAELSRATVRSLRFYEEAGLLAPRRDPVNGYRRYGAEDVGRLQEILLLRRLGIAVRDIAPMLSGSPAERREVLCRHLAALKAERTRLDDVIATVERTLAGMRGEITMTDREKFEGLKRKLVEENEENYGNEARRLYGDGAIDEGARRVLAMGEKEFDEWQALGTRIRAELEKAVKTGADPEGTEGERVCNLHRRWLTHTWPTYSAEAHRALEETYVTDERFTGYYDRAVPGCAAWLRDAVAAHAGRDK